MVCILSEQIRDIVSHVYAIFLFQEVTKLSIISQEASLKKMCRLGLFSNVIESQLDKRHEKNESHSGTPKWLLILSYGRLYLFLDPRRFALAPAHVVELCSPHFSTLNQLDLIDRR